MKSFTDFICIKYVFDPNLVDHALFIFSSGTSHLTTIRAKIKYTSVAVTTEDLLGTRKYRG